MSLAPAGLSLIEAINFAHQQLEQKKQATQLPPEVIDLTFNDDEDEEQAAMIRPTPVPSHSGAMKEEVISPPVSTVKKPGETSEWIVTYMHSSR